MSKPDNENPSRHCSNEMFSKTLQNPISRHSMFPLGISVKQNGSGKRISYAHSISAHNFRNRITFGGYPSVFLTMRYEGHWDPFGQTINLALKSKWLCCEFVAVTSVHADPCSSKELASFFLVRKFCMHDISKFPFTFLTLRYTQK